MKIGWFLRGSFALVLFCCVSDALVLSQGQSGSSGPALLAVMKEPQKFVGQKVCWVGKEMESTISSDRAGNREYSATYMGVDASKSVVIGEVFAANHGSAIKRTTAAEQLSNTSGDPNIRLVCGTITASKSVPVRVNGELKPTLAPVLTTVTVDAPPK